MAPRPYWKGYLKLSLVACPVSVFTATTSSERVSFRQINKQTGNRLRQQLVDDVTREVVESADKVRGYEVDKNVYIRVEDEEVEALEIESMTEALRVEPDNDLARLIRLGCAAQADDPKPSAIILEVRLIRLRHRAANILIYTEYTDSQVAAARALGRSAGSSTCSSSVISRATARSTVFSNWRTLPGHS